MRDELRVGWMVRCLDADDSRIESALMLLHVPKEVQLRLRRTHEEDLFGALQRPSDLVKETMLVVGMIPDSQVLFVGVTMNVGARRIDDGLAHGVGVDLEDARLFLINPYDCVPHGALLQGSEPDRCMSRASLGRCDRPPTGSSQQGAYVDMRRPGTDG
jgi:hypothetical protein